MKSIEKIIVKLSKAISEYPLVLLCALFATAAGIWMTETNFERLDEFDRGYFTAHKVLIVSLLGVSWQFVIAMSKQRFGFTHALKWLGLLPLICFYVLFFPKGYDLYDIEHYWTLGILAVVLHLIVAFIPFLRGEKKRAFWQYNQNLFIYFILTALFSGVLVGGLQLAVLAFENLFDLNFSENVYLNIFVVGSCLGSVLIFLLFIEDGLPNLTKETAYPIVFKFFTQYVLIPLLFLYGIILYGYGLKILFSWSLPRGYVSYLAIGFSLLGILALLLVHPLVQEKGNKSVAIFHKIFYYSLLPILVLLFVAIGVRLDDYGFTEPRYIVLAIGLWLLFLSLYFILRPKGSIRMIPISLAAMGAFALVTPFFNAFSLSEQSQEARLKKILTDNKILSNGKFDFTVAVSDSVIDLVEDKLSYLASKSKLGRFAGWIEKDSALVTSFSQNDRWLDLEYKFPNRIITNNNNNERPESSTSLNWRSRSVRTSGYNQVVLVDFHEESLFTLKALDYTIESQKAINNYADCTNYIIIKKEGEQVKKGFICDLFPDLWKELQTPAKELDQKEIYTDFMLEGIEARLHLRGLNIRWRNGEMQAVRSDYYMLLKE